MLGNNGQRQANLAAAAAALTSSRKPASKPPVVPSYPKRPAPATLQDRINEVFLHIFFWNIFLPKLIFSKSGCWNTVSFLWFLSSCPPRFSSPFTGRREIGWIDRLDLTSVLTLEMWNRSKIKSFNGKKVVRRICCVLPVQLFYRWAT